MFSNLSSKLQGLILLTTSAFIYSLMPLLIRHLDKGGVPIASQTFLRYIFAFICAIVYLLFVEKKYPKIHVLKSKSLLAAGILGYGLTNLFFTYGISFTTVSTALFLYYTYVLLTPILGAIFLKERLNQYHLFSLLAVFIALLLLFQPSSTEIVLNLGIIFAIFSSLAQASYFIFRKKVHNVSAPEMMVYNTALGLLTVGIISIILDKNFYLSGNIFQLNYQVWLSIFIFGIMNFCAWLLMTKGFELIKGNLGGVILLSELVFSVILASLVLQEPLTISTVFSGILIIFACTIVTLKT